MKRRAMFSLTGLGIAAALVAVSTPSQAQRDVRPADVRPPAVQDVPRAVTPQSAAGGLPTGSVRDNVRDVRPAEVRPQSAQDLPREVTPQTAAGGLPQTRATPGPRDVRPAEVRPPSAQDTPRAVPPAAAAE